MSKKRKAAKPYQRPLCLWRKIAERNCLLNRLKIPPACLDCYYWEASDRKGNGWCYLFPQKVTTHQAQFCSQFATFPLSEYEVKDEMADIMAAAEQRNRK